MTAHRVFAIQSTIDNGFDVVKTGGVTYLRVVADGRALHAVPQTSADLRKLAALMLNAADTIDQVS